MVVVLITAEECRASTGAQPVTVSRSRAARKRPAARAPAGCGGAWGPGRGGVGLPPPSARSSFTVVNADLQAATLLDQRRPPHAGKPEPPRLGSRRRSQGRLYNFKGLWAGPLN